MKACVVEAECKDEGTNLLNNTHSIRLYLLIDLTRYIYYQLFFSIYL